jgi:uncharacterized protein (DUF488 family)
VLQAHGIRALADVRRFPGSRRHPHFGREQLEAFLGALSRGVEYVWMPELGGRRRPRKDSPHTGWRVEGFRGYADYMETEEFATALSRLLDLAQHQPTAIMCAEQLWWKCHRRLISDALLAQGHEVVHIENATKSSPHKLVPPAHLVRGQLSYAAEQPDLEL